MNRDKSMLHEILHGNLSPWLDDSQVDEKYIPMLANIKEPNPSESHKFKLDFPRAFNSKTKYYSRLIRKSINEQVSFYISQLGKETDESVILYLLDEILDKNLKNRIREVGELIREKDYSSSCLRTEYLSGLNDAEHKSNTYIVQLLKLAYIQIYLEVQEEYRQYRDDILHPEDFYFQLLHETVPAVMPISKIVEVEVQPLPKTRIKVAESEDKTTKNSFVYKKLATHPEQLNDLRNNLIKNGFIAEDTSPANFTRIFSGKAVITPVKWLGLRSELSYFIKLIHNEHSLVENLKQDQWKVVPLCFVDKDNSSDTFRNIRKLQRPEIRGGLLDKAVKLLF